MSQLSRFFKENPYLAQAGIGALVGGATSLYGDWQFEDDKGNREDRWGQEFARSSYGPAAIASLIGGVAPVGGISRLEAAGTGALGGWGGGALAGSRLGTNDRPWKYGKFKADPVPGYDIAGLDDPGSQDFALPKKNRFGFTGDAPGGTASVDQAALYDKQSERYESEIEKRGWTANKEADYRLANPFKMKLPTVAKIPKTGQSFGPTGNRSMDALLGVGGVSYVANLASMKKKKDQDEENERKRRQLAGKSATDVVREKDAVDADPTLSPEEKEKRKREIEREARIMFEIVRLKGLPGYNKFRDRNVVSVKDGGYISAEGYAYGGSPEIPNTREYSEYREQIKFIIFSTTGNEPTEEAVDKWIEKNVLHESMPYGSGAGIQSLGQMNPATTFDGHMDSVYDPARVQEILKAQTDPPWTPPEPYPPTHPNWFWELSADDILMSPEEYQKKEHLKDIDAGSVGYRDRIASGTTSGDGYMDSVYDPARVQELDRYDGRPIADGGYISSPGRPHGFARGGYADSASPGIGGIETAMYTEREMQDAPHGGYDHHNPDKKLNVMDMIKLLNWPRGVNEDEKEMSDPKFWEEMDSHDYRNWKIFNEMVGGDMRKNLGRPEKDMVNKLRGHLGEYYEADGGFIQGPGGPRTDSIPARLSDGEFVMTADAVHGAGGAGAMYDLMDRLEGRV